MGLVVGEVVVEHAAPQFCLDVFAGFLELDLEEETTLEGIVEVVGEVGGGNQNAVELFHLLEDDVLHGVVHLLDRCIGVADGGAAAEDGIGLVEEEDGHNLAMTTDLAIAHKDCLDVLFAFADILVAH